MTPKAEAIQREMQGQLDLGKEAIELYMRDVNPDVTGFPPPHELTAFLMRRLKKTQAALRVAIDDLTSRDEFDKDKIGEPVPEMLEKVKAALKSGKTVKIFTARASEPENVPAIKKWLKDHDLPELEITNEKTKDMDEFWDDKARGVVKNHGVFKD